MKRALDVAVSSLALTVLSPLLFAIAIAIRLDSQGAAIFRQTRVGLHGQLFDVYKFRSMRVESSGPAVTVDGDARITRVGGFLRASKLDELPQLWNVMRGDMSIVGPRPEVPGLAAHWPDDLRNAIVSVRPGITDPASVAFRREAELLAAQPDPQTFYLTDVLPQKARMYANYAQNHTLAGDLRIILRTIRAVVRH